MYDPPGVRERTLSQAKQGCMGCRGRLGIKHFRYVSIEKRIYAINLNIKMNSYPHIINSKK